MMSVESSLETAARRPIQGLLLLLVLWLGVVGPSYSFALNGFFAMRWRQAYPEHADFYASWDFWGYIVLREGLCVAAGLALWFQRQPGAVWFAIAMLWLSGPALVLLTSELFGAQVMPWALIRSTALAAAITLYLVRSERVRLTYNFKVFA
jgi:hypothetical protein